MSTDQFAIDSALPRRPDVFDRDTAHRAQHGKRQQERKLDVAYIVTHGLPITFQVPAAEILPGCQSVLVKNLSSAHLSRLPPSSTLSEAEINSAEKKANRVRKHIELVNTHDTSLRTVVTLSALPVGTTAQDVLRSLHGLVNSGKMVIQDSRVVDARVQESRNRDKSIPVNMVARVEFANAQGAARLKQLVTDRKMQINGVVPWAVVSRRRGTPKTPFGNRDELLAAAGDLLAQTPIVESPTRTVLDAVKRMNHPVRRTKFNYNREEWEATYDEAQLQLGVDFRDTQFSEGLSGALLEESQALIEGLLQNYETLANAVEADASQQDGEASYDDAQTAMPQLEDVEAYYKRQMEDMAAAHQREMAKVKRSQERKMDWIASQWRRALDEISRLKLAAARFAQLEQEARMRGWLRDTERADEASSGKPEPHKAERF